MLALPVDDRKELSSLLGSTLEFVQQAGLVLFSSRTNACKALNSFDEPPSVAGTVTRTRVPSRASFDVRLWEHAQEFTRIDLEASILRFLV